MKHFETEILSRLAPVTDVPIVFTSAVTKQRVLKILEEAMRVYENKTKHVSTAKLNEMLAEALEAFPPPAYKGKFIKIKYVTQLPRYQTPCFAFFCNLPQYIKDPYKRYLENKIRETFDFTGVPIQLFFRQK